MGDPSGEAEPRITDEAIERLRGHVGIPVKWGDRPAIRFPRSTRSVSSSTATGTTTRCSRIPTYATASRWGALLAPPMYFMSTGVGGKVQWTDAQAAAMSGGDPVRGIGQYLSSERWAFVRPVTPGLRLRRERFLHDVEVRDSRFGGGRVVVADRAG